MIGSRLRTALLAAGWAVFGLAVSHLPAAAQPTPRPQITVTGAATVSVEPDMALLRAGVVTDAKTAKDAGQANSKAMTAVMAAVQAAGIAERDLQTARYAIQPIYESGKESSKQPRIASFQAVNSLAVKIREIDRVGEIIDKLFAAGANSIGGVEFVVSDPSKPLDQARADAVADARRKAEFYAKAAGVNLGGVFTITEQSAGVSNSGVMMMRAAAPAPETPISPGERTLHVSVSVTFDLNR